MLDLWRAGFLVFGTRFARRPRRPKLRRDRHRKLTRGKDLPRGSKLTFANARVSFCTARGATLPDVLHVSCKGMRCIGFIAFSGKLDLSCDEGAACALQKLSWHALKENAGKPSVAMPGAGMGGATSASV
jgi:hypothetical protein